MPIAVGSRDGDHKWVILKVVIVDIVAGVPGVARAEDDINSQAISAIGHRILDCRF